MKLGARPQSDHRQSEHNLPDSRPTVSTTTATPVRDRYSSTETTRPASCEPRQRLPTADLKAYGCARGEKGWTTGNPGPTPFVHVASDSLRTGHHGRRWPLRACEETRGYTIGIRRRLDLCSVGSRRACSVKAGWRSTRTWITPC